MDYRKREALIQQYTQGFSLMYRTTPGSPDTESENIKNFQRTQQALAEVGVDLHLEENGILSIELLPEKYVTIKTRTAGRKRSIVPMKEDGEEYCTYKDMLILMQKENDKEIMRQLGMKKTTYYRHKKRMLESALCQKMDKERIKEEDYLEEYFERYNPLF